MYAVVLKSTGERVAVKVQRPDITQRIALDMHLVRSIAPIAGLFGVPGDLVGIVDAWGRGLVSELDYTQEASNIEAFLANFDGDPMVKIPAVYPELCSEKVLCASPCTSDGSEKVLYLYIYIYIMYIYIYI